MSTAAVIAPDDRVLGRDADAPRPAVDPAADGGVAGYPTVIWLLLGGNLLVRSAGFAYPFLAYHVAQGGHAAGAIGMVMAAYGVGWAVGQLVCGSLVGRIGTRLTLVSTMAVAATVLALMAGARSFWPLLAGAVVAGLVWDAPRLVLGTVIADLIPDPARRAKLEAWRFGWVVNAGALVTGGLGGLLAGWLGTPILFWINGIACAVFALVAANCLRHDRPGPAATRMTATAKAGYRQAFSDKRLVLLSASAVATLTALLGFLAAVPILMTDSGLSVRSWGYLQVGSALAVVAITPVMTPWLSRRLAVGPRLDVLAASAVWGTLCVVAAVFAHTTFGFTAAAIVAAPAEVAYFVVGAGVVYRIAPPANVGRYQGIWAMTFAVSSVTAPLVASFSLTHGGRPTLAVATLTIGLLGAALCSPLAGVLAEAEAGGRLVEQALPHGRSDRRSAVADSELLV